MLVKHADANADANDYRPPVTHTVKCVPLFHIQIDRVIQTQLNWRR